MFKLVTINCIDRWTWKVSNFALFEDLIDFNDTEFLVWYFALLICRFLEFDLFLDDT